MRGFRLRAPQLGRRGAARPSTPASSTASALPARTQAPATSLSLLHQHAAASSSHINSLLHGGRSFSVSSKFPTQDESAILAHSDEQHDPTQSQLVCGSCSTPISQTRDLIFFKWKNGIHLSSTTDAPLRSLCSQDHWDEDTAWKKHKLHCLKCGHHVGTMAKVFASDKILFSAKQVAIQMPANQSPLISVSGYPSSQLGFSYWTELILMLESQPTLKDALQIRRVDQIRDFSTQRKQLNTKLLMAKDLPTLLRIVDDHAGEMNDVNICTAVVRVARFSSNQTPRKNRVSVTPRLNLLAKSEAPEDQLLDISSHMMTRPRSAQEIALEKQRFWKLVQLVDNLVNFSISALKEGHELANFMKSIWQLGIGRPSILEPIAKQVLFVLNTKATIPVVNEHEASIIATSIVHLSAKEDREQPWVKQLLHAAANRLVEESARKGEASGFDILIPLVRAFVIAGEFHEELFTLLFSEVRRGRLESADQFSQFKVRNLKSKMYQVHLDCALNAYPKELRLKPAQMEEFKEIFQGHQVQVKSSSFRIQHLVSSALDEMGVEHERSLTLDEGYCLDIALKHNIAIEINEPECYQVLEAHEPEGEADKRDFIIASSMDEKPFGFVDLKARHLEELGWVVIQLRADKYMKLASVEDRVRFLSVLLEVANNARRQQHTG
ncbi:hypothetical protein Gpo141_00008423 [Globisporangium polare]